MIQRTFDTDLVRAILSDPELKKRAGDGIEVDIFDPDKQRHIYYLLVADDNIEIIGLLVFHVLNNPIMYEGHLNYLPEHWGLSLEKYTIEGCQWMFNHTDCQKIIGFAPDYYPEVKRHALKAGFIEEGYLSQSIMYNNKLTNQTIMGVAKCQPQQQ